MNMGEVEGRRKGICVFTFHKREVRGYMDYESQMYLFTNPTVKR